jgi:hypothetical protein
VSVSFYPADPIVFGTFGATPGYGWPFGFCPEHQVRWRGNWDECWLCEAVR